MLNVEAVFLKESWKCMQKWEETSEDRQHRKLIPVGVTRAKDQALTRVFGCFDDPKNALYVDLLLTLASVTGDESISSAIS